MAEGGEYVRCGVEDEIPASALYRSSGSSTLAEGNRVDQTFIKSPVNVAGRDLHNTNITVLGQLAPNKDVNGEELISVVNEHTRQETASGIRADFENEFHHEPDFEVFPQMKEVSVHDYYKGRLENPRGSGEKGFRNQLTEEIGFYRRQGNDGKSTTMEEIMESMSMMEDVTPDDVVGYTAIVASAGSGKTTLTRRIARKALGIPSVKEKYDHDSFKKLERRMIHYMELKDINQGNCITTSKFLFGGLYKSESDEEEAFDWLVKHQSEAIIIFDGLDQVAWDFEESSVRKIKPYEKASVSLIMYNILSRKILRHVKIIVSSREFKVSELPAKARPDEIITLNGLTLQDAYKLFTFLLGENGKYLWEKIENMSPRLLQLVSVPVFLILIAVVMGRDPIRPPPSTVTELYNRIISVLRSVDNIRNRRQISVIINKLKAMAFHGMEEGRVVFNATDLERFGVSADEVKDLMTKVPGNNILSRHLMEGDFTFFFCHQSMQEFLAACFASEMNLKEFSLLNDKYLHEKRWSVVRRFVTGVVYMKHPGDLHQVSNQTKKQQILAPSILAHLEEWKTGINAKHFRMELYTTIYESADDDLIKNVSEIDASFVSLSRDEAHIVGSLVARTKSLDSLKLAGCNIGDELLKIIARCQEDRIHVKGVELRNNNFSAPALHSLLGHRRIKSLSGNLHWDLVVLDAGELRNGEDAILIRGRYVAGHFNIKESTLILTRFGRLTTVTFLGILFEAKLIKINCPEHVYVTNDDLMELSKCKLEKISKILLDCTGETNIDWSLIETCSQKYQFDLLDIAVNGQISDDDYNRILESGMKISGFGNIHAFFFFTTWNDSKQMVEACLQKKIEYIRCILSFGCRPSLDDISSSVSNSNSKKVTLICENRDMLKVDELKKAQTIANDLGSELEVLSFLRGVNDAWRKLDIEFLRRGKEMWRKMQRS